MREGDGSLIRFPVSLDREADGLRFVFLHRVIFSFNAVGCRSYSDGQRDGLPINDQLQGLLAGTELFIGAIYERYSFPNPVAFLGSRFGDHDGAGFPVDGTEHHL